MDREINLNKNPFSVKASSLLSYNYTLKPSTKTTKYFSILAVLSFLIALIGGSYIPSYLDNKIDKNHFTISRALQYGNRYVTAIFFILSFMFIIYLNYLREDKYFFKTRVFLLTFIFSFLITIIWVNVDVNLKLHYTFAFIVFVFNLLYLFIIYHIFNEYLKSEKNYKRYIIDILLLFSLVSFIVLSVFANEYAFINSSETDHEVFASFENIMIFFTIFPILYLGFI